MLIGEYHHNLDEKGRITIPSKFREDLGESIIVTRGLEDCLFIYKEKNWSAVMNKLNKLPFTKKNARYFSRIFISGASTAEFDKQGRINLPLPLIKYASLQKECIIIGVGDRLEIWSKEKWNDFLEENKEMFIESADHLFDIDFEV